MKKLFIAASVVGAAAAGLILYATRKQGSITPSTKGKINDAASSIDNTLSLTNRQMDRPPQHAMG